MKSLTHILDRAQETHAVARKIEEWQWPERSSEEWGAALQEFEDQQLAELSTRFDGIGVKGQWDVKLAALHTFTSAVVRLGRVRFRAKKAKARTFDFVKPDAKSRASICAAAERLSELWSRLDAAWKPEPELSLTALDALLKECEGLKRQNTGAEASWAIASALLAETAEKLDADCVAWYADATTVFPAGTVWGRVIRAQVPTTTAPQPPPGQAVIANVTTAAGGEIRFEFAAPHGTRFTVLHRTPGEVAFKPVLVNTAETSVTLRGLAAGEHRFKVLASNSRGEGPESAETVVAALAG